MFLSWLKGIYTHQFFRLILFLRQNFLLLFPRFHFLIWIFLLSICQNLLVIRINHSNFTIRNCLFPTLSFWVHRYFFGCFILILRFLFAFLLVIFELLLIFLGFLLRFNRQRFANLKLIFQGLEFLIGILQFVHSKGLFKKFLVVIYVVIIPFLLLNLECILPFLDFIVFVPPHVVILVLF